ncbi:MAG TPA: transglutaminase-like cysteine peptidase [Dongiaceae bacterium]
MAGSPTKRTWRCVIGAVLVFGLLLLSAPRAEARRYPPLFGSIDNFSVNWSDKRFEPVVNWLSMRRRWNDGAACANDRCTSAGWASMVAQVKAAGSPMAKIIKANDLVNDKVLHPYKQDMPNYGYEDYWATAFEFLKKSGDCEDFAITKFMLLKAAGFSPDDMMVLQVSARNYGGIGHAILVVYFGDKPLILDILTTKVMEARYVAEYTPIISVTEKFWSWHQHPNM